MKTAKASLKSGRFRIVNLYARFTPEGPDAEDERVFMSFWLDSTAHSQKLRDSQLAQERVKFARLKAADRKVTPIILKVLHNEIPVEVARRKFKRLVPDKTLAREVFDTWDKALKATPEQIARENADIARREVELTHSGRLLKARKAILNALTLIFDTAMSRDAKAANDLAEAGIQAASLLYVLERKRPELAESIARGRMQWPVLANQESGWEKKAVQRVANLKLGADIPPFNVRFRKARGTDANLPARRWAKAAVRVIEETRWRFLCLAQLIRDFGSREAFGDFWGKAGWEPGDQPGWVKEVVQLKSFSKESLREWKPVIREMIREQVPDFHTRPEWINQRNTASSSGRDTPGEIQNAILDDKPSQTESNPIKPNDEPRCGAAVAAGTK